MLEIFSEVVTVLIVTSFGLMIGVAVLVGTLRYKIPVPRSFGLGLFAIIALIVVASKFFGASPSTIVAPGIEALGLALIICAYLLVGREKSVPDQGAQETASSKSHS